MNERKHYRTVFISDLHIGFRNAKTQNLLAFLKSFECDQLYLVGDIFDMWAMKSKMWWDHDCTSVVRRILKMMKHGTKVFYVTGNHDDALRSFVPFSLGDELQIVNEVVYVTKNGVRYLVIHGDICDCVAKWLSILGTHVYDWLITWNSLLHSIRKKLGFRRYWSLSAYLKRFAKQVLSTIKDFETAILHHARQKECDGVICGHIHTPKMYFAVDGGHYVNCGDWVESLTAVVEDELGMLSLIQWHDL